MAVSSLPFSLAIISDYLEHWIPPEGSFDPAGEWEHRYVQWMAMHPPARKSFNAGELRIRRFTDRGVRLAISQTTHISGSTETNSAMISCADDALWTPTSWSVDSAITDAEGKPVEFARTRVTGGFSGGAVTLSGGRRMDVRGPLTSNWSLLASVQRLPFEMKPLEFSMLEDLELLKPDQRLYYRPPVEVTIGGHAMRLHSFEQIGRGILPYTYWLDDQHRLLFAIGGLRTYILDTVEAQR